MGSLRSDSSILHEQSKILFARVSLPEIYIEFAIELW